MDDIDEGERLAPLGLIVSVLSNLPQLFFPMAAALVGTKNSGLGLGATTIVAIVLAISLLFQWIGWLRFRYHIDDAEVRIESGVLNRTARSIPFDRIQDVSIEQKFLPRLLGLGEVKFETGGGEKSDDSNLRFVSMGEAERLRATIRSKRLAGASKSNDATDQSREETQLVFAMDTRRLVIFGLFSFSLVIFAILGGAAQQLDFLLPLDLYDFGAWIGVAQDRGVAIGRFSWAQRIWAIAAALAALIVIGFASGIIRTFLRDYGFALTRTDKGFRRQRGLMTRTDISMPLKRVQAAVVQTGPIRERWGWHTLKFMSLAEESKEESDHVVVPFGTLGEIWPIVQMAHIDPPSESTKFTSSSPGPWLDIWVIITMAVGAAFTAAAFAFGIFAWPALAAPPLLALLFWLDWRFRSHAHVAEQLFGRHGWWQKRLDIARAINVQSVSVSQGPLEKRRGLASVHFGIAGGSFSFASMPIDEAHAIRNQVLEIVTPVDFSELNRSD